MEKLRINYITDKQTIDRDTLKEFQFMDNRRRLREIQVRKLKSMILEGIHFDSPIIVNEKEGKQRVLDGQHRIKAVTDIIGANENFQIEVTVIKYKDLSPEMEKEIFVKWNSGTRQSSEDFISIHLDDIKIFNLFDRWKNNEDFPIEVTVYKGPEGSAQFRQLVQPYLSAKEKILCNFLGPVGFVEEAKKLTKQDYEWIKQFTVEFLKHTTGFNAKNTFSKTAGFSALMFLYMNGDLKPKLFWEKFEKVKNSKPVRDMIIAGGFVAARQTKKMLAEKMGITHIEEKVVSKGPTLIFTEDRIEWLRKNWPRSTWNKEDLAVEFDEKFGTKVSEQTISYYLSKNGIKKDPEFQKMGPPKIYTPKVIEFMKKCADKGMSSFEAKEETQKEFKMPFMTNGFRTQASTNKIKFRLGNPKPKFSKIVEKIIEAHKELTSEEIRDKIIEKTEENISAGQINHYLGRTRYQREKEQPMTKKEIQKSLKDIGADDEDDPDFTDED